MNMKEYYKGLLLMEDDVRDLLISRGVDVEKVPGPGFYDGFEATKQQMAGLYYIPGDPMNPGYIKKLNKA